MSTPTVANSFRFTRNSSRNCQTLPLSGHFNSRKRVQRSVWANAPFSVYLEVIASHLYWPWSGYEPGKLSSNLDWTLSPGSGSGIMLDRIWITVRVHRLAGSGLQVHRGGGAERGLKNHTGKFTCSCTKISVMR